MARTNLNAHRVFFDSPNGTHLLAELTVGTSDERALRGARDAIRAELLNGFREWQGLVEKRELFNEQFVRKAQQLPSLRPKFRMQGSAAYHTLNDPAHKPPQQIDYDDGVFLPVSFLVGSRDPMVSSAGYFQLVEAILLPLTVRRGWKLRTHKPSCVRVEISDVAHIDLPLYAIADEDYQELVEKAALAFDQKAQLRDNIALDEALYANLAEGNIRLAHRVKGWIESDPRAVEQWFKGALDTHGEQLRRVCRYVKGWRDFQWPKYVLSSITLMKCVIDIYDELGGTLDAKRDDFALLEVAQRLPAKLKGPIRHPVVEQFLDEDWTPEQRATYIAGANTLFSCMQTALMGTDAPAAALAEITKVFGDRVPDDASLIVATSIAAQVFSYPREKVPAPYVPKTTSG